MKKAFSIVEVLFVLVIIGLLSAIALSVYTSTRNRSSETTCLSNLRQIGMGIKMYESDYGDLPRKFETLYPTYVSDKRIFRCPQWEARIGLASPEKQAKYMGLFTMYTYEPEEANFWQALPREAGDPVELHSGWQSLYTKRGEQLPLVVCQFHDPLLDADVPIGPDGHLQITRIVLRLDGSVGKTTAHQKGKGVSWSDL